MRVLTVPYPNKRLILKSPPHTGRVAELLKIFPRAKFVHLTRDPRKLFYSTLRLWQSLDEVQSLQTPVGQAELREYVWTCLTRMYDAFESQRSLIPAGQLIDLKYEDLVADPLSSLERIYSDLHLGDFELIKPQLEQRLAGHKEYRANRHVIDEATEAEILQRWRPYAERYGYL